MVPKVPAGLQKRNCQLFAPNIQQKVKNYNKRRTRSANETVRKVHVSRTLKNTFNKENHGEELLRAAFRSGADSMSQDQTLG